MPTNPYLVSGTVFTSRGKVVDSIVIVGGLTTVTNSLGQYVVDLANLTDGYTIGNSYTLESYDEHDNEYTTTDITLSGENYTQNLYLEPRNEVNSQTRGSDTRRIEPRTVGNKPVTTENLLPVQTDERKFTQKLSYVSGTSKTEYVGRASPGTPTSEARWRIEKWVYSGNNIIEILWASGNVEFDKIWDARATYDYS